MKKKTNKPGKRLDSYTPERTIGYVQKVITKRLKTLGKSRLWLAEQIDVRPATVYDFMSGADTKVKTLEKIMTALGLELRAKD